MCFKNARARGPRIPLRPSAVSAVKRQVPPSSRTRCFPTEADCDENSALVGAECFPRMNRSASAKHERAAHTQLDPRHPAWQVCNQHGVSPRVLEQQMTHDFVFARVDMGSDARAGWIVLVERVVGWCDGETERLRNGLAQATAHSQGGEGIARPRDRASRPQLLG